MGLEIGIGWLTILLFGSLGLLLMLGLPMAPQVFFMSAFLFLNALVYVAHLWRLWKRPAEPA